MLNWLLSFFKNPHFTGVVPDPRTQGEKNQDYKHEERTFSSTDPFSNQQILQSPYFYENQNRTSSCVPHGVGLALAIERKADADLYQRISQMFAYRLRENYPAEGCYLQDIFDVYRKQGACLFTTLPTPLLESQANALTLTTQEYNEAAIYKGLTYYTIGAHNDINTLASVAAQGHGVAILIFATSDEWGRDYPELHGALDPYSAEVRHCVCVLPNSGFIKDGKKYVTIQDSAWFGGKQLRHLSEDWVKSRVLDAAYWDSVQVLGQGNPPVYHFSVPLRFGNSGTEVKAVQQLLISEGLLPNDCATGYFGGRTLAAVKAFQSKYMADILLPVGLSSPTGLWGPSSMRKANSLSPQP